MIGSNQTCSADLVQWDCYFAVQYIKYLLSSLSIPMCAPSLLILGQCSRPILTKVRDDGGHLSVVLLHSQFIGSLVLLKSISRNIQIM